MSAKITILFVLITVICLPLKARVVIENRDFATPGQGLYIGSQPEISAVPNPSQDLSVYQNNSEQPQNLDGQFAQTSTVGDIAAYFFGPQDSASQEEGVYERTLWGAVVFVFFAFLFIF